MNYSETTTKPRKRLVLRHFDVSKSVEQEVYARASDQVREEFREEVLALKQHKHFPTFLSGMAKLKQNILFEAKRQTTMKQVREQIQTSGIHTLFGLESRKELVHQMNLRVESEEEIGLRDTNGTLSPELKEEIVSYINGAKDKDELEGSRQLLWKHKDAGLDTWQELLTNVEEMIQLGESLEHVDIYMRSDELDLGVHRSGKQSTTTQLVQKIQQVPGIGKWADASVLALAIGSSMASAKLLGKSMAHAAAAGAGTVLAGVFAGASEYARTEDAMESYDAYRASHAAMAETDEHGIVSYGNHKFEHTSHDLQSSNQIIHMLRHNLILLGKPLTKEALKKNMREFAGVWALLKVSREKNVNLIAYSSEAMIEHEKMEIAHLLAKLQQTYLQNGETYRKQELLTSKLELPILQRIQESAKREVEKSIEEEKWKEKEREAIKRREAMKTAGGVMAIGGAVAALSGLVQEGIQHVLGTTRVESTTTTIPGSTHSLSSEPTNLSHHGKEIALGYEADDSLDSASIARIEAEGGHIREQIVSKTMEVSEPEVLTGAELVERSTHKLQVEQRDWFVGHTNGQYRFAEQQLDIRGDKVLFGMGEHDTVVRGYYAVHPWQAAKEGRLKLLLSVGQHEEVIALPFAVTEQGLQVDIASYKGELGSLLQDGQFHGARMEVAVEQQGTMQVLATDFGPSHASFTVAQPEPKVEIRHVPTVEFPEKTATVQRVVELATNDALYAPVLPLRCYKDHGKEKEAPFHLRHQHSEMMPPLEPLPSLPPLPMHPPLEPLPSSEPCPPVVKVEVTTKPKIEPKEQLFGNSEVTSFLSDHSKREVILWYVQALEVDPSTHKGAQQVIEQLEQSNPVLKHIPEQVLIPNATRIMNSYLKAFSGKEDKLYVYSYVCGQPHTPEILEAKLKLENKYLPGVKHIPLAALKLHYRRYQMKANRAIEGLLNSKNMLEPIRSLLAEKREEFQRYLMNKSLPAGSTSIEYMNNMVNKMSLYHEMASVLDVGKTQLEQYKLLKLVPEFKTKYIVAERYYQTLEKELQEHYGQYID